MSIELTEQQQRTSDTKAETPPRVIVPREAGAEAVAAMLALADRHDLRRRAEAYCRKLLCSAATEGELAGLAPEDVQAVFERSALVFDHGVLSHPFVETRLGLFVDDPKVGWFRGLRPVGHYRLITRLDGTDEDDYFVLDEPIQAEPGALPDPAA